MQKKSLIIFSLILVVLFTGLVSASWFSDVWNKITGNAVVSSDLISYYKFDNSLKDSISNNDLIANGPVNYSTGKVGSAVSFSGLGSSAYGYSWSKMQQTNKFSISMWAYKAGDSGTNFEGLYSFLEKWKSGYAIATYPNWKGYSFIGYTNKSGWFNVIISDKINLNEWNYLTVVYDSGLIKTYINGQLANILDRAGEGLLTNNLGINIGKIDNGSDSFFGRIDEVKTYGRALSDDEVRSEYEVYVPSVPSIINNSINNTINNSSNSSINNSIVVSCFDSDNGINYYISGNTFGVSSDGASWNKTDYCDGNIVHDYNCNGVVPGSGGSYNCPNGCLNGACVCNNIEQYNLKTEISKDSNGVNIRLINRADNNVVCNEKHTGDDCTLGNVIIYIDNLTYLNAGARTAKLHTNSGEEIFLSYPGAMFFSSSYCPTISLVNTSINNSLSNFSSTNSSINNKYLILDDLGQIIPRMETIENGVNADMVDYLVSMFSGFVDGSSIRYYVGNLEDNNGFAVAVAEFNKDISFEDFNKNLFKNDSSEVSINYYPIVEDFALVPGSGVLVYSGKNLDDKTNVWVSQNKIIFVYAQHTNALEDSFNSLVKSYLGRYKSSLVLPSQGCTSDLICKNEPVVCPVSGMQTKTCYDKNNCVNNTSETIACTPGSCAGCDLNSKCLSYGVRLFNNGENVYCDYDGVVKIQKISIDGNWASCQNNYECFSNLCSGGECVEINSLLDQAKGFKAVGIKILCKLAGTFGVQDENQCLAEYLGGQ